MESKVQSLREEVAKKTAYVERIHVETKKLEEQEQSSENKVGRGGVGWRYWGQNKVEERHVGVRCVFMYFMHLLKIDLISLFLSPFCVFPVFKTTLKECT